MKNLIFIILFPFVVNAQVKDVKLINDSLSVLKSNNWEFRGSVLPGIKLDAGNNLIIHTTRPGSVIGRSFDNLILGNNTEIHDASSIAALATDSYHYFGSNYSFSAGDANLIGGYASTTTGFGNKNFVDMGTSMGVEVSLGRQTENNKYSGSVGIGKFISINNGDLFAFGLGDKTELVNKGTYLLYGSNKFGLLPDGRVLINGIAYRFPTTQQAGVLTNDGFGNLSWGATTSTPITAFKVYNTSGQLLFYQPIKN